MILAPFALPSNPLKKITLREATVSDALDFCDADPRMEEMLTTLFLNRVQQKEGYHDSQAWTMEDRRFALYWYYMHTSTDTLSEFRYTCQCGETHKISYDMKKLADGYKQIKGKCEREIVFESDRIMVRPLTGRDAEALEMMRLGGNDDTPGTKARIRLSALARNLFFLSSNIDEDRVSANAKKLENMTVTQLEKLAGMVSEKLSEMEHGLESVVDGGKIHLMIPTQCPHNKEVMTWLRVPFRSFAHVPMV